MKIVKTCKKHGNLTENDIYMEKNKKSLSGYQMRCHLCKIDKDRRWKFNNKEQHIEASSRWKRNNREHVNAWVKQDRKKHPEKYKKWTNEYRQRIGDWRITLDIINYFGLTLDQYNKMFEEHNNLCGICKNPEIRRSRTEGKICRLAVDHCHKTGKIRGLLCHSCNTGIGKFMDDIDLLKSAIQYLEKYKNI